MASSPHGATSWRVHESQVEYDLLVQEPPPPAYVPQFPHGSDTAPADEALGQRTDTEAYRDFDPSREDAYADEDRYVEDSTFDHEYAAAPGIPGRGVAVLTIFSSGVCALTDFALTGGLSFFFDLCFIVVCLVAAMSVRRRDLFTAGVLPPLAFAFIIAAVALVAPSALAETGGMSRAFLTGLAAHAPGLVIGYAVALCAVAGRVATRRWT